MTLTPLILKMGEQNVAAGRGKFQVFYCPTEDHQLTSVESHVFAAIRNKTPLLQSHGFSLGRSIMAGKNKDIVGTLRELELQAVDNLVFKIFASFRLDRKPMDTAGIYFKIRTGGALNRISLPLIPHPANVVPRFEVFGKFDILSPDEAKLLGVKVPSASKDHYTRETAETILTFEELAPAVDRKQSVQFKQVGEEAMPVVQRRRSLRKN